MLSDLRFALRTLAKSPGFAVVAVVTLAVAIGVNSAIFSLVNGVMLRRIAPADVVNVFTARKAANRDYRQFSYPEFAALREPNPAFRDVAALSFTLAGVGRDNDVHRSFIFFGSDNLLPLLGARPAAGRFFTAAEARPNANIAVAVASYPFWQRLGGRPDFIGSTLKVNGRPFTVIGVTPRGFTGINAVISPDLWLPLGVYTEFANPLDDSRTRDLNQPTNYALNVMARLRPGLTLTTAQPLLAPLERRLDALQPPGADAARELQLQTPSKYSISTSPTNDGSVGFVAILLLGMAGVVLLIACLNLANMLLARGSSRAREFAIRLAVGAPRWRVVRQLLVEGLLLALAGGGLGLLIAEWSNDLLVQSLTAIFQSMNFALAIELRPDATVVGVTLLLCLAATLVFSLGPALKSARADVVHDLKQQTGEPAAAGRWNRFFSARHCLIMLQIALSLVLLVVGGLFLRSAANAAGLNPGFDTRGGIVAEVDFTLANTDAATARRKAQAILARMQALPGVRAAALATLIPYGNIDNDRRIMAAGTVASTDPKAPPPGFDGLFTAISPQYFQTLGVPLLQGRTFTTVECENRDAPPVAILDERMAGLLFPKENAVGRRIRFAQAPSDGAPAELEVVGVVKGFRHEVGSAALMPRIFVPLAQTSPHDIYVHLRLASDSPRAVDAMLGTVRDTLRDLDPDLPVLRVIPFASVVDGSIGLWVVKLGGVMFGAFGAIALILAVVGVYGVKAYAVARRTREIGIRMALGAMPGDVFALVMRQGVLQTAVATVAGLGLALLVGRALSSMLFNVSPADPLVLAIAVTVLAGATLLACYLPARRATRVSPTVALRTE
jgi:putative ABC transport system permease protein